MDMQQETKTIDDDGKPVNMTMTYPIVVKQSLDQFAQQADDNKELPMKLSRFELMNDDCLLAIFSVNSLTPMDLCSIAETCPRFKEIAQLVFPKEFIIDYEYKTQRFDKKLGSGESVQDVERVLNHFGSSISAFSIDGHYNDSSVEVMELVTKYCADSLERLKISSMEIPEVLSVRLKPIFQRLLVLNIEYVDVDCGKQFFASCDSLLELRVWSDPYLNAILENVFPQLERFSIVEDEDDRLDIDLLLNFIKHHKSLRTLILEHVFIGRREYQLMHTIGTNLKDLKELRIVGFLSKIENCSELQSLDQLQTLHVYEPLTENIQQLQALKSLKTLTIEGVTDDVELFPALSRLTNLRELHLYQFYERTNNYNQIILLTQLTKLYLKLNRDVLNVVDIIRRLTNLEHLEIHISANDSEFFLTKEQFREIIKVVAGRSNVLTLECSFDFNYLKFCSQHRDENVKVKLKRNERWHYLSHHCHTINTCN